MRNYCVRKKLTADRRRGILRDAHTHKRTLRRRPGWMPSDWWVATQRSRRLGRRSTFVALATVTTS
jgi:hypothetical protein